MIMTQVVQSYQNIAIFINNDNVTVLSVKMLCCISNSLINTTLGNNANGTNKKNERWCQLYHNWYILRFVIILLVSRAIRDFISPSSGKTKL